MEQTTSAYWRTWVENWIDFDLTIAEGDCATLSEDGGPAGACAITNCVGHDCSGCGF